MNLLLIAVLASAQQLRPLRGLNLSQIDSLRGLPVRLMPENYYVNSLPFFCKKEWQIEKITKIPFRIRLGGLDYVDRLEGKGMDFKQAPKPAKKN